VRLFLSNIILKSFFYLRYRLRKRRSLYHCCVARLSFCSLLDSEFTTIVATAGAYGVIDVMSTAVGANSQSGHYSHVMGTTFRLSGVRLSSFRMCHNYLQFTIYNFKFTISNLCFGLFLGAAKVSLEKLIHFGITLAFRVTVHCRKINYYQFICQPFDV